MPPGDNGQNGQQAPNLLTDEIFDKLDDRYGQMISNALTSRFKNFEKTFAEKMSAQLGETLSKQLEGLKQARAAEDEGDGKDGKRGGKDPDRVKIATMEARLAEVMQRADASDKRAQEERAKNRNAALRQRAGEGLSKIVGIEDEDFRAFALNDLIGNGQVKWADDSDDNSAIEFVGEDGVGVALEEGLKRYAKTPRAQKLIPPKGVKGAGTRPRAANGAGPAADKGAVVNEFWENFAKVIE